MGSHALLSASSSKRWLNCPPSAKLCAEIDDTTSEYAKEGTDAHTLCEYKVKRMLGIKMQDPTDSLTYYNEEMERCANDYGSYISHNYMEKIYFLDYNEYNLDTCYKFPLHYN